MKRGFTLIEILVAMVILIIVIGSTLAIFRASATSWQRGQLRSQRYQAARFILDRMTREISSSFPSSLAGPHCLGSADRFYFICALNDIPTSLAEVGYWLDENSQTLMRSYELFPDYKFSSFEKAEVLGEDIQALNFFYYTGETWRQDWDSRPQAAQSGMLPKAVKVTFDIKDQSSQRIESFETVITIATAAD